MITPTHYHHHHGFDDCEGFGWLPDFWLPSPLQHHLHGHDHDHQDQNHFIIMNAYISWIMKSLVDSLTSCHPLPLIRVLWVVFGEASTSRLEIKFKTCNFYFHQKKTGILAICILVELKHKKKFSRKKINFIANLWSTASVVPAGKSKHMSLCSRADPEKFLLVKAQTLEILFLN